MWKYGTVREPTDDNVTRCMRIACWIIKATDTNSEYVPPIVCPRQQWRHERAKILRLYIHCVSSLKYCTTNRSTAGTCSITEMNRSIKTTPCISHYRIIKLLTHKLLEIKICYYNTFRLIPWKPLMETPLSTKKSLLDQVGNSVRCYVLWIRNCRYYYNNFSSLACQYVSVCCGMVGTTVFDGSELVFVKQ